MVNISKLVRPNILNLKPYSSARSEFSGKEGIFLDANENPYGSLNRYPDPFQRELKEKIAGIKSKFNSLIVDVLYSSSDGLILAQKYLKKKGTAKTSIRQILDIAE